MGIFEKLFPSTQVTSFVMSDPKHSFGSPWATHPLSKVVLADILGETSSIPSRDDAMRIPAVVRGRQLVCGTLSRYPLLAFNAADDPDVAEPLAEQPAWLTSTSTGQSPLLRTLWTLDDLIFYGLSVWTVARDPQTRQITDAFRVPPTEWEVDPDSLGVLIQGQPANADEVIIFEGPQEGLINIGSGLIEGSRNLAASWQKRVKSPIPLLALKQTEANTDLTQDEVDDALVDLETARQQSTTVFVPYGYDTSVMGDVKTDLFVEGRNAERIDWANMIGLPAAMIDGSMATATLTYSTTEGKRSEFVDYSLSYWATPMEARLSQDDVTPDGTCVRFNLSWLTTPTQPGTNPPSED